VSGSGPRRDRTQLLCRVLMPRPLDRRAPIVALGRPRAARGVVPCARRRGELRGRSAGAARAAWVPCCAFCVVWRMRSNSKANGPTNARAGAVTPPSAIVAPSPPTHRACPANANRRDRTGAACEGYILWGLSSAARTVSEGRAACAPMARTPPAHAACSGIARMMSESPMSVTEITDVRYILPQAVPIAMLLPL